MAVGAGGAGVNAQALDRLERRVERSRVLDLRAAARAGRERRGRRLDGRRRRRRGRSTGTVRRRRRRRRRGRRRRGIRRRRRGRRRRRRSGVEKIVRKRVVGGQNGPLDFVHAQHVSVAIEAIALVHGVVRVAGRARIEQCHRAVECAQAQAVLVLRVGAVVAVVLLARAVGDPLHAYRALDAPVAAVRRAKVRIRAAPARADGRVRRIGLRTVGDAAVERRPVAVGIDDPVGAALGKRVDSLPPHGQRAALGVAKRRFVNVVHAWVCVLVMRLAGRPLQPDAGPRASYAQRGLFRRKLRQFQDAVAVHDKLLPRPLVPVWIVRAHGLVVKV